MFLAVYGFYISRAEQSKAICIAFSDCFYTPYSLVFKKDSLSCKMTLNRIYYTGQYSNNTFNKSIEFQKILFLRYDC